MIFNRRLPLIISLFVLLAACGSTVNYAPVDDREKRSYRASNSYTVSAGETLYSIAWRYGLDFKALASTNNIRAPYTIYPGQRLSLKMGSRTTKTKIKTTTKPKSKAVTHKPSVATKSTRITVGSTASKVPSSSSTLNRKHYPFRWLWPSKAKLTQRFSLSGQVHKGVDLKGKLGESVTAANSGTVVYAGSGLVGYGKLLIIKHNDRYLSAYGHNNRLLVSEGERVKGGQKIAEMGRTGADEVKLHFEIRKDGKPVNPLKLLPKRT